MPALPSPGNVIKVSCAHAVGDITGVTSRFFISYTSGAPSAANLVTMAAEVGTLWGSHLGALASTAVYLDTVTCTDLSSSTGAEGSNTGDEEGSRAGTLMGSNTCMVIDYEIARRYRGGKPRGFWPFGVQGDLAEANTWSNTLLAAVNSDFGAFMAALLAYSGDSITKGNHVSVSWYEGFTNYTGSGGRAKVRNTLRAVPVVDQVLTHNARNILGSQRRRLTMV